jgi:hypothetical protein
MRFIFVLAAAGLFVFSAAAPVSRSAPIDGAFGSGMPPEGMTITKRFRGGERASAQVNGDHDRGVVVSIAVYDDKNTLIAEDKGRDQPVGDMAAVIWYPPRDGNYRITIRTSDQRQGKYFVAIH